MKQAIPDIVALHAELEAKQARGRFTSAYAVLQRGCSKATAMLAYRLLTPTLDAPPSL